MREPLHAPIGWQGLLLACAIAIVCNNVSQARIELPSALEHARIDQHVGQFIPQDLTFTDDQGQPVRLDSCFAQRPAILVFTYYTCPNLCPMLLHHLTEGLNGIGLVAGRDFDVVVVSFDPTDTPASARTKKIDCLRAYGSRSEYGGWHFLTGTAPMIDRLKQSAGFHCVYDAQTRQYVHPLGAIVLGPGGLLSHYFFGVDFSPADLEAALKDAAAGRSTWMDRHDQQYCLNYSPAASRYGRLTVHILQALSATWVLLLLAYIGRELARDWRKPAASLQSGSQSAAAAPTNEGAQR